MRRLSAKLVWVLFVVGVLSACASAAGAQDLGVRAGVSGDPSQFYLGAHADAGPVAGRLRFRPNVEVGIGDDSTLTSVNFEFVYPYPLRGRAWRFYPGIGPALILAHHRGRTNAGGGLNLLLGVEHRDGFFAELKIGALDSAGVKFGVGYTFRH